MHADKRSALNARGAPIPRPWALPLAPGHSLVGMAGKGEVNIPLGPLGAGSAAYLSAPGEASDDGTAEPPLRGPKRLRLCGCWVATLLPLLAVPAAVIFGLTTAAGAGYQPGPNATRVGLGAVDAGAVCNDGTEAVYYFAPATDPAKKATWLIWLEGGGNCHDEASCKGRGRALTSSAPAPRGCGFLGCCPCNAESKVLPGGMMGSDDPSFGGANLAYVPYCTSDLWLGDRAASNDTWGFAFRGSRVVRAVLRSLQAQGLGDTAGTTLVLSGCSAGAMGSTVLCDRVGGWLRDSVRANVKVGCVFDSNLPVLDVPVVFGNREDADAPLVFTPGESMAASMPSSLELYGVPDELYHPTCVAARPAAERWKCAFPQYVLEVLDTPWLTVASRFDSWGFGSGAVLEIGDNPGSYARLLFGWLWPLPDAGLDAWGEAQGRVTAGLPTAAQPYGAVFQPGCIFHCGPITNAQYARMSAGDGTTLRDALRKWFEWTVAETQTATEQRRWVDTEGAMAWPRGSCIGGTDLWVSLFRSFALLWLAWAGHLALRSAAKPGVTALLLAAGSRAAGALRAAREAKAGPGVETGPGEAPPRIERQVTAAAWGVLWLALFTLCVLARNV